MKFTYEYRTSDNVRHTDVVSASDREAAFALLKARGIRPGQLREAPGFFNKLFGKGKRWMAIAVLLLALAALLVALVGADHRAARAEDEAQTTRQDAQTTLDLLDSPMRRQPIGDTAVIEKGIRTGWADAFDREGDRFLASFAVPGYEPAIRSTTVEAVENCLKVGGDVPGAPRDRDSSPVVGSRVPRDRDTLESRQIRAMVEGMKNELRQFLKDGGTIKEYGQRLVERQEQELKYFNRVKTELETAAKSNLSDEELEALWEDRNSYLRKMGIRLVPLPEER